MLQISLFKEIKKHQNLLRNFHNIQGTRAPEENPHMYKDMGPPQRKIRAWNQIQNLYYRVTVPTTAPLFYFKGPILLVSSTCNPARFSVQPGKHLLSPGITVSFVKPSTTVHARKFVVKVFNTLISPEVAKVLAQMNFFFLFLPPSESEILSQSMKQPVLTFIVRSIQVDHNLVDPLLVIHRHILR